MFDILNEIFEKLADLLSDGIEFIIDATVKKHFLIRLPVFSIMWLLWLILFPIYIVVYTCVNLSIDLELFLIYVFCLATLAAFILYPHQIELNNEQYEWIEENLKRWTYVSFFDGVYLMNLEDVMAFKLRWL